MQIAIFLLLIPSCSLVDAVFPDEFSDSWKSDKQFNNQLWESVEKNVFLVQDYWEGTDPTMQCFPNAGKLLLTSEADQSVGALFDSYIIVDPSEKPADWTYAKGETWVKSAHQVDLCLEDIPLKVSRDGEYRFSRKTQSGTLVFTSHLNDMAVKYKTIKDCKLTVSGQLTKGESRTLTGDLEIKIITPEKEYYILNYKEMTLSSTDMGFLKWYL